MQTNTRKVVLGATLAGLAGCLIASVNAWGQDSGRPAKPGSDANATSDSAEVDTATSPLKFEDADGGDEGGIAGPPPPVVYDNGPVDTGEPVTGCTPNGTQSSLQNTTLCLDTLGSNGTNEGATVFWLADDFTLTQCTNLATIEFLMYETGATTATITSMNVQLHSAQPADPTTSVIQTATGGTSAFTTIYRAALNASAATLCTRRLQRITVDVSAWPDLAAGTYWLSWQATGSASAGPWHPSVTILGQHGKPGANALQATGAAGPFLAVIDDGPTGAPGTCPAGSIPPPVPNPQDFPFTIRGNTCGGGGCPADIDGNGAVDVDDLIAVILDWGCTGAACTADVDNNSVVDVDDLIAVILGWGACP